MSWSYTCSRHPYGGWARLRATARRPRAESGESATISASGGGARRSTDGRRTVCKTNAAASHRTHRCPPRRLNGEHVASWQRLPASRSHTLRKTSKLVPTKDPRNTLPKGGGPRARGRCAIHSMPRDLAPPFKAQDGVRQPCASMRYVRAHAFVPVHAATYSCSRARALSRSCIRAA